MGSNPSGPATLWVQVPQLLYGILRREKLYNMMLVYVSFMEKSGKTGSYVKSALKAVKSWLSHNGKKVKRRTKIKGSEDTPSLKDERVPTNSELMGFSFR